MTFYKMDYQVDGDNGTFPQVSHGKYPVHVDDPLFSENIHKVRADRYITPIPILANQARRTDLVSSAIMGTCLKLLVSDKLKMILEAHSRDNLQFMKTTLLQRGREHDYWLVNPYRFDNEWVDYPSSVIQLHVLQERTLVPIVSHNDFEQFNETSSPGKKLFISQLVLRSGVPHHLLVLDWVQGGGIRYYVSEKLEKGNGRQSLHRDPL